MMIRSATAVESCSPSSGQSKCRISIRENDDFLNYDIPAPTLADNHRKHSGPNLSGIARVRVLHDIFKFRNSLRDTD